MAESTLDEFGILGKTGKRPRKGIKEGKTILNKFTGDYGPVPEYEASLENDRSSKAYDTFQKDYAWLEVHIGRIADFMYIEHGISHIYMSAYFVVLSDSDHDCVQIKFPYENTVLNYHYSGPNFAQCLTSTIREDITSYKQKDLADQFLRELMESIPDHQLRHMNWIEPKFISNYALDADPHFTIEMEIDLEGMRKDNSGIYADLFIQERKKFPFFPFQPVFAGKKEETAVIILPKEELFDIEKFRNGIARRTNIDPSKIKIDRRYDFKIATEDLKYSVGLRTAHNIRIKYRNPTHISDRIVNDFVRASQQGLRCAQKCTTSDYIKGKDKEGMEKGLIKRILDSYQNPSFANIGYAIFGPPEELTYFDDALRLKMNQKFRKYKKRRLDQ